MSGVAILAVSTLASPSYGWLLKAESSNCDEFAFSVPFAVDPATGDVSGTPSLDGTCSFTVEITDGTHVAEKLFTLNISPVNDSVVYDSGASTLTIEHGTSFSETIQYTDEDDTPTYALDLVAMTCDEENWIVSLNIDSASGVLSGTPDFLGSCTISVSVASGVETVAHAISFTSQDTVAPNSPSAFALGSGISSPTTNQQPSFDVTVTAVEGSIKLYSGAGCTNYLEAFAVSGLNESITVSSPLSEGDYNFSVSHVDPSGNESVCSATEISLRIDTTDPNPPSNLQLTEFTNDAYGSSLSFDASSSTDVASYLVKLEDSGAGLIFDWTSASGLGYQSPVALGLSECGQYRYFVKAVDEAGRNSSEVSSSLFTFDTTPPGLVSNIQNLDNAEVSGSEEHTFNEPSDNCVGLDNYQIAVSSSTAEADILVGWEYQTVAVAPYRIYTSETLAVATPYYSLIRSVDKAGNVSNAVASNSWLVPGPPAAVDAVSIISASTNSIELGWNEPFNGGREITDYLVEYKETASSTWLNFEDGVSNDIVLTVDGLSPDTSYDFRVTSWNGNFAENPSPVVTGSTFIDDPFFDDTTYKLMNIAGATNTSVVAFEDGTEIKLDGVVIANLDQGGTHQFASTQGQTLEANKPIFAAGNITGSTTGKEDGNVIWSNKDLAGKVFNVTLTRYPDHVIAVYSFEDSNSITLTTPSSASETIILQSGGFHIFQKSENGGYSIESSGLVTAYTYSTENNGSVVDPKPIMVSGMDLIGIPSRSVKITTSSASADVDLIHGDDSSQQITLQSTAASSVPGIGKVDSKNEQYKAEPLRITSTEPVVANSNADSDGYCSAPFVPTAMMKKRFAINVFAEYVAFASLYDATITIIDPDDGSTSQVILTRTGINQNAPYSAYLTNMKAGTVFISDKRVQGWYEPNTNAYGAKDDETLLIGYD